MIERADSKRQRIHFDSLPDLAQWLDSAPRTWSSTSSIRDGRSASWDLGIGYKQAWKLARDGWIEGAQRAQEALKQLTLMSAAPENRNDFYGHLPHVARYCAGAPDSMIRKARSGFGGGKTLTLIVPIGLRSDTEAQCAANWGLGIAQYVNQLEQEGTRVEVIAAATVSERYEKYSKTLGFRLSYSVLLKRAEQPLDLVVLAFAIGHPTMYRRLGLALYERSAMAQHPVYGYPQPVELDDVINVPAGAVILNGMIDCNETARTPETALEYIGKQIEAALEQVP